MELNQLTELLERTGRWSRNHAPTKNEHQLYEIQNEISERKKTHDKSNCTGCNSQNESNILLCGSSQMRSDDFDSAMVWF